MSYKQRILDIQFLVSQGYSIVEIEINEISHFFQTNDFEPPSIGSVMSAPYLTFKGIDITEFIDNSGFNQASTELYKERFNNLVNSGKQQISFKFSDKHVWRFFN